MPDVGTSAPPPPGSHTATEQWQSFELRMRRRRAERCVLNAQTALEEGRIEEARGAIEEARKLGLSPEELAAIEEQLERPSETVRLVPHRPRISAPRPTPPVEPVPVMAAPHAGSEHAGGPFLMDPAPATPTDARVTAPPTAVVADMELPRTAGPLVSIQGETDRRRRFWRGTAAAAALAIAAGSAWAWRDWRQVAAPVPVEPLLVIGQPRPDIPLPVSQERQDRIAVQEEQIQVPVAVVPEPPVTTAADASGARPPAPLTPQPSPVPEPPPAARSVVPQPEPVRAMNEAAAPAPVLTANLASLPPLTNPPVTEPPVPPSESAAAAAAATATARAPERVTPPASKPAEEDATPTGTAGSTPAAPAVDETARVRAVLARYASAYSALDAAAAHSVWPTVDQRALARAFSGLASQDLSLGRCDVALVGTTARAECAGTATWRPRVGGGVKTQPRRWNFELRNTGTAWQIVRAETR